LMPVLDLNSPKFNEYYLKQFEGVMDEHTFHEKFLKTLQEKLPVTFRINSGEVGFEKVCSMLREKDFIE
jgi:16S rRNA C967 or C1407 C5-methylase (RsmB/RsmF family)